MDQLVILLGSAGVVVVVAGGLLLRRLVSGTSKSRRAHEAAQSRPPPVEIGETYEFGVTEFTDHHSGARVAVGKVEGFVVFAEDVPDTVSVGDVVRAKVLSFNRGKTSADATVIDVK
jgi:predicted RNA-binding protein with TRAM domain